MNQVKRPILLSIICIIGFAWITFSFPGVFAPSTKKLGVFAPAIYGLIIAFSFISFIGIWHMKKWGVELYVTSFFAKQIFFLLTDEYPISGYAGLLFSVWFIISFLIYYKKMDRNL